MRLLLIAPPGAGKGTQGRRLAADRDLTYVSTGDLLRAEIAAGTPLGEQVREAVQAGDLIPDELMAELLREPLRAASATGGFVLDGFPRTLPQAELAYDLASEEGVTVHAVLALDVDEATLRARLQGRSGTEQRADDTAAVQRHRLDVYAEKTRPLLDYYARRGLLHRIDATGDVDEVYAALVETVDRLPVSD